MNKRLLSLSVFLVLVLSLIAERTVFTLSEIDSLATATELGTIKSKGKVLAATTNGLVGYWKFDEGNGTMAVDSSGNGNNGTITGPVWVDGKENKGLSFRECCFNDSVNVGTPGSLNNLSSLSVSFWVNLKYSTSTRAVLISKSNDPYGPVSGWGLYLIDSKITFKAKFSGGTLAKTINYNLIPGVWTHVVMTWDGNPSSGLVSYIDGIEKTVITNTLGSGTYVDDSTRSFMIGNYPSLNRPANGFLDEIRIYNRVLNASESVGVYTNSPGNSTPSLDLTAPQITGIQSSSLSSSSMNILWNTDENADTQVEYGLTTSYGSSTVLKDSAVMVTNHSVIISGLSPATLYHFRVKSRDTSQNLAVSADQTFTTISSSSDTVQPSKPVNLSSVAMSSTGVSLTWSQSTDNVGVVGYYIYRNNTKLTTSVLTSYSDFGLNPSTSYSYKVSAYDAAGNESVLSDVTNVLTLGSVVIPPSVSGSVNLKGPDGVVRSHALQPHPRVWFDGPNGVITSAIKDPDGTGPQVSSRYNNPVGAALRARAESNRNNLSNQSSGIQPLHLALGYFMDNNAKFNDGTSYLTEFIKVLDNVKEDFRFGGCQYTSAGCGTVSSDYAGEAYMDWALAYTLIRDYLSPSDRTKFSQMMFNGITDPWCEQRLKRREGVISKNGVSVTLSGAAWDSAIKVGGMIGIKNSTTHGSGMNWFRILSISNNVLTVDASFPDYASNGWYYTTDPWTSNSCGFGYFAMSHANVPSYLVTSDTTTLSASISATVNPPPVTGVTEQITVSKTNWMPQVQLPYMIWVGSVYPNSGERMRVISVSGNKLTVVRGELDTTLSHAQNATVFYYPIDKYEAGTADFGLDNRNLTRAQSMLGMAIALADDDPRAASVIEKASVYFYDKTYVDAKKYWTLHNTSAVEYGLARTIPHFTSIVMSLKNSFNPPADFTGGEYLKNVSGLHNLYWTTPWDNTKFLRWGVEAGENCSTANSGYLYSLACFIAPVTQQLLYPNDLVTKFSNFQHMVRNDWYQRMFIQAKLQSDAAWVSGINAVRILMAGDFNSFPTADFTLNNTLPTSRLWANGDSSVPGVGLNTFVSKTDWSKNASQLWGLYTDTYSDKMLFAEALSTYSIGKNGWLIDNNYTPSTYAPGIGYQSSVDFGPAYKAGLRVNKGDLSHTLSGIGKDNYAYFLVDALRTNENNGNFHQVQRELKHFVHLKLGKEYFVVYDDVAKGNSERIRSFIHYPNNAQNGEGVSALDSSASFMDSRNLAAKILTTFLLPNVVNPKIYDLGVNVDGGNGNILVGSDCTVTAPCRVSSGPNVYSFNKSYLISGVGPASGNAYVYIWLSNQGVLSVGKSSNMQSVSVPFGVSYMGTVNDFPADAVVRLGKIRFSGATAVSSECPGTLALNAFSPAREWGSCVGLNTRVVFMDAGTTTKAEFIAVHRPTSNLQETPDNISNILAISPTFVGTQIDGVDSAAVIFSREGKKNSTLSFTTSFLGTGRYLISGLIGGQYSVVKDGTSIGNFNVGYDGTLYFNATKGLFQISLSGQPLPPPPVQINTPTIVNFLASPLSVSAGQSSILSWSVTGATSLSINQGVGTVTGNTKSVSPTVTTTYTLSAVNASGTSTKTVTVNVGATPPPTNGSTKPTGSFDGVDTTKAFGWASDSDTPTVGIDIHLYIDKNAGTTGATPILVKADQNRSDVGDHAFNYIIPEQYRDNKPHSIWAWAIDSSGVGANNIQLTGSPKSFTLAPTVVIQPPPVPTATTTNVLRTIHIDLEGTTLKVATGVIQFVNSTNNAVVKEIPFTTNTNGDFSFYVPISLPSTIFIRVKITGYLPKKLDSPDLTNVTPSTLNIPKLPAGDFNGDGVINSLDYSLMIQKWLQNDVIYDINKDGVINSLDYSILSRNWNKVGE